MKKTMRYLIILSSLSLMITNIYGMNQIYPTSDEQKALALKIGIFAGVSAAGLGAAYYLRQQSKQYGGWKPYLSSFISRKSSTQQSILTRQTTTDEKLAAIEGAPTFNEWFDGCNHIHQQQEFSQTVNGQISNFDMLKANHQIACMIVANRSRLPWGPLSEVVDIFAKESAECLLSDEAWVAKKSPFNPQFFELKDASCKVPFLPFIQGLKLKPETKLYFFGDRHGDVCSTLCLLKELQSQGVMSATDGFKIQDQNCYIISLGDYTDRGVAGSEVIFTMLELKRKNPNNVILVRGNHEDTTLLMNAQHFQKELEYKYPNEFKRKVITRPGQQPCFGDLDPSSKEKLDHIRKIYDFMPVALFIGTESKSESETHYLLASHANLDLRYNPKRLFEALYTKTEGESLYEQYPSHTRAEHLDKGQLASIEWGDDRQSRYFNKQKVSTLLDVDFCQSYALDDSTQTYQIKGTEKDSCEYGKPLVEALIEDYAWTYTPSWFRRYILGEKDQKSVTHWVIRGHQHDCSGKSKTMKDLKENHGVTQAWNDQQPKDFKHVLPNKGFYTMQMAPDNPYLDQSYGLNYDTCAEITTGDMATNWSLRRINVAMWPICE